MPRWEPDSRGRLERAAMALYDERGFEQTTVAEIAERAGLAERTFFRHYADKREVLFGGAVAMQQLIVDTVADAPDAEAPLDLVAAGLEAVAGELQGRRDLVRQRQRIIAANGELRERELVKLAAWSAALTEVLRRRGLEDARAALTAEMAVAVFRVSIDRWVDDPDEVSLPELVHASLEELRTLAVAPSRS